MSQSLCPVALGIVEKKRKVQNATKNQNFDI